MTVQPSLLFVAGLGYSAVQLAPILLAGGWSVMGTVRTAEKARRLQAAGLDARVWDGTGAAAFAVPAGAHWLITLPPGAGECPAAEAFGGVAGTAASMTYLSTTGVYGDLDGGWAFEWSPLNPQSERTRARCCAEAAWQRLGGQGVRIVRLPGIYGPGRSAFDRLRAGDVQAIVKPGQVFSRVHVDDVAAGLAAILQSPAASGVFHLCDDEPAPPEAVTACAAALLGLPPPVLTPFADAKLSPMARSFYSECKRISNGRAKSILGWRPQYPTYREGLAAVLAAENASR
jgi:hypothetical protein